MAKIYVNGDAQEVSLPLNVSELIRQLLVENPEMVSVQVNEEFAEREDWERIQLKEDDKVDFLYFMGGEGSRFKVQSSRFSDLKVRATQGSMTKFSDLKVQSDPKVDDKVYSYDRFYGRTDTTIFPSYSA